MARLTRALAVLFLLIAPHPLSARALAALAGDAQGSPPRKLRAVSLNALQRGFVENARASRELLTLGGLTRIAGYVIDEQARDLILVGEATPGAPALQTQDLAVALRYAWRKYGTVRGNRRYYTAPGCSIDPDPEVLRRLNAIGQRIATGDSSDQIQQDIETWNSACQSPQQVRVMGIPRDTHFAKVMVDADYFMKRLVDGSVAIDVPGFTALCDMALASIRDSISQNRPVTIPAMSLNRFWFYPGPNKYAEDKGVVMISECPVVLLTKEQHLTRAGVSGSGRPNPLALEFTKGFSAHYAEIAQKEPIYQELEGLFRFVALASIVRYRNERVNLDYLLERFPVGQAQISPTLPGISNVKHAAWEKSLGLERDGSAEYERVQNWEVWLPSCGGVSIDLQVKPQHFVKPKGQAGKRVRQMRKSALGSRPSPNSLSWDFRLD